jgi:hypothetical protein
LFACVDTSPICRTHLLDLGIDPHCQVSILGEIIVECPLPFGLDRGWPVPLLACVDRAYELRDLV